jgi:hypothetical protein
MLDGHDFLRRARRCKKLFRDGGGLVPGDVLAERGGVGRLGLLRRDWILRDRFRCLGLDLCPRQTLADLNPA